MEALIIGLGRFGSSVATTLIDRGVDVSAVDNQESRVKELLEYGANGYVLDSTDKKALEELSVEHFDVVIVALGKSALNASLLTSLNLLELEVHSLIAKASSSEHYKLLQRIGVPKVVQPEHDMGRKVALHISNKDIIDYIELSNDVKIDNVKVSKNMRKMLGKSIQEINLRKRFNVNIVGIQRGNGVIVPDSDTQILQDDILIILGKNEDIGVFEEHYKIK